MKIMPTRLWSWRFLGLALAAALARGPVAEAGHEDGKVLILAQPTARGDALWMALTKGFFKAERLDVTVRWSSGGNEILRAFKDGPSRTARKESGAPATSLPSASSWP